VKNWSQTLLSRFAGDPALAGLISSFDAAVDPHADIQSFYKYIWNVKTAVGNGLNIWGTIVGVSRVVPGVSGSKAITLLDPDYQTLILVKAAANIGNVTIPTLNRLLRAIFAGSGLVYVQDNLNMTMTYVFLFQPSAANFAIVENSGVMPRPAGVLVNYVWRTATAYGLYNTVRYNTTPYNSYNPQGSF